MQKVNNYSLIVISILGLVMIRFFERSLFYDPLLHFFRTDFRDTSLPEMDVLKLMMHLMIRYAMNMVFSLMFIYGVFKEVSIVRFSFYMYAIFGVILILLFYVMFFLIGYENHIVMFYVRRFLIQPILLMLFVPGIFFQRALSNKRA